MRIEGVFSKIEDLIGQKITGFKSISGGSIATSNQIRFEDGKYAFLKTNPYDDTMFFKEANGLKEIHKTECIRAPKVLLVDSDLLLLEFIEEGRKDKDFFSRFGFQMANLHRKTSSKFGFKENNFIGATPQTNIAIKTEATNWCDFYYNKRLLYQYELAESNGLVGNELKNGFLILESRIEEILEGSEEKPSLLHGDLWSGNFLCDQQSNPCIMDPAVYYGHREADLAMTKLFGGFPDEFYRAYQKENPLPQGFDYRENIYLLYHVLNHLNLFGNSYYGQAVRLVWSYLH
ncbi:fructosamine kinase family protein [Labilibaculum sp. DW002]|jgi:protein-ribulosamine 3-kinase|uniref:Fructosamine kinase family protein n=1 Tax=Paralabilibaculum antarcticum TaxID=2912572 RepID=A0ABT5VN40_9BACT|nr:fructosamine kinase family protein [Labilibaculum sp. DW002]MDE5416670.1 fructosamine kinase family protein [Labilibaculum sp. DW002]